MTAPSSNGHFTLDYLAALHFQKLPTRFTTEGRNSESRLMTLRSSCLACDQISEWGASAGLTPDRHGPTHLLLSSSWPRPRWVRTHCSSCCIELVLLRLRSASCVGVLCGGPPVPLAGLCSPDPLTCGLRRDPSVSVDTCAEVMLFFTAAACAGCSLTLLILVRGRSRSPPSFWKPYRSASRCFLSSSVVVQATAAAWSRSTSRLRSLFWISGSVSCDLWFSTWLLSCGPHSSTFSLSNLIKNRHQSRLLSQIESLDSATGNGISNINTFTK